MKHTSKGKSISKQQLFNLFNQLNTLVEDTEQEHNDEAPSKYKQKIAQPAIRAIAVDNLFALITGDKVIKPPAMAESTQYFIPRITEYPLPRNLGIPSIGVYDGTTDPEDFLIMFESVMRLQHWEDETACHMFPNVLQKMGREWFASLPPRSITSFLDLRAKFVMQFQSLRSCTLSHLDAHEITIQQNESLSNFMKRYTIECQKIPNIPESQLLSGFIFCLDQHRFVSLIHALRYDVPKTLHQALVVAQKHLRAGEMGYPRVDNYHRNFRQQGGERNRNDNYQRQRRYDNNYQKQQHGWKGNNHLNDNYHYRKPLDRHPLIMALTKTPKQILFTEPIKETFHPPPPMKERQGPQSDKWCDFHEAYGHDTDNCKSVMREIIAKIKAGELKHLLPGKQYRRNDPNKHFAWQGRVHHGGRHDWNRREERNDERDPTPERHIKVVWKEGDEYELDRERRAEQWMYAPIIFHTIPNWRLSEEPVVISAVIANKRITRIYSDIGSEADILYLDCFKDYPFIVQDRLRYTNLKIAGITGESMKAVGKVKLEVMLGAHPLVRTEIVDFTVLDGRSRFNALFGRRTLQKFRAITSTPHAELRFPTPNGVAVVHSEYVGPVRERSVIYEAKVNFVRGEPSRQLFSRNDVNGYFKPPNMR
ncbi:uncharacterized protein [Rutidosis leptorrhynchoides]|uniref:uncharacterized protein n=1 Tax=Rutidosis leptorrhynchoides TaxID=125765 RepID=UPI003A9926C3